MKDSNFKPEEFLGTKIVSPLEQEKLIGGITGAEDKATVIDDPPLLFINPTIWKT